MFQIRDMKPEDKEVVMSFVEKFYQSDAVAHTVPRDRLEQTFRTAASDDPILRGVVFQEEEEIVGYAYLTFYFACEAGGKNLLLEEVYMKETCRGKGYGKQFFKWMFHNYPEVVRFRLEVTRSNKAAVALYKRLGFQHLDYDQMILDVDQG